MLHQAVTGEQVDAVADHFVEESKFQFWNHTTLAAIGYNSTLTDLVQREHSMFSKQTKVHRSLPDVLSGDVKESNKQRHTREDQIAAFNATHIHRLGLYERTFENISRLMHLITEQIESDRSVREKGVHMKLFNKLLNVMETKLNTTHDQLELLLSKVQEMQRKDRTTLRNLTTTLSCVSCRSSHIHITSYSSIFKANASNENFLSHQQLTKLEPLLATLNEKSSRLKSLLTLAENRRAVEITSDQERRGLADETDSTLGTISSTLDKSSSNRIPLEGPCNATEKPKLEPMPGTLRGLFECASICFGNRSCTYTCLTTPSALSNTIHPSQLSTLTERKGLAVGDICVSCLTRVASCLGVVCAVPCAVNIGCGDCLRTSDQCNLIACM
jgi:hypothetical protein